MSPSPPPGTGHTPKHAVDATYAGSLRASNTRRRVTLTLAGTGRLPGRTAARGAGGAGPARGARGAGPAGRELAAGAALWPPKGRRRGERDAFDSVIRLYAALMAAESGWAGRCPAPSSPRPGAMALDMLRTAKGLLWSVYLKPTGREAGWQRARGLQYGLAAQGGWFSGRVQQTRRERSIQTSYILSVLLCADRTGRLLGKSRGIYGTGENDHSHMHLGLPSCRAIHSCWQVRPEDMNCAG
jgi:hypothetical protein